RATVLMDSGIRSGVDVGRALVLGATAVLAGKAFLWSLGALGEAGPPHAIDLLIDELKATLGQVGATIATARTVEVRHPGALSFGASSGSQREIRNVAKPTKRADSPGSGMLGFGGV